MYKNPISLLLLATVSGLAMAKEPIQLDVVTVTTATKTEKAIDGVTASIVVINAEQIRKTGAATLKDVFNKLPSLTLQYGRFPHPSSKSKAAISIRGAGANGTLLLIDGKRLSGETENPYEMDRIPAAMIDRIEIVKGSMSTLYGSDAIGGVINIITKQADEPITAIDIKYGQNGDGDAQEKSINLSTMGKVDRFSYRIYGSLLNTEPFTINQDFRQQAVHPATHQDVPDPINGDSGTLAVTFRDDAEVKTIAAGIGYDISDKSKIGFDISHFNEDREGQYIGLHPKPRPDLPFKKVMVKNTPVNSVDKNNRTDLSIDMEHITDGDIIISARAYQSKYEKRNTTTALGFSPAPENKKFSADVTIDGAELTTSLFANDYNRITMGAEYRKESRNSAAINPDPTSNEFVKKTVSYKSLFLQDEIELSDSLNATVGVRHDAISNADSKTTFKAGIIKNLANGLNLRANFSQGYRSPDVAELFVVAPFFRDAMRFGSEVIFGPKTSRYDLKPETSETFELAISKTTNKLQSELTLFQNNIKDKITLVTKNNNTPAKYYTTENLDDVTIRGIEASASYLATTDFDIAFHATLLDTEDKATGKELTFTPGVSLAAGANYQISQKLSSALIFRYLDEQFTDAQNTQEAGSYSTADLSLAYHINAHIELYGGINNLADTTIDEELGSIVGRFFYTGIRSQF